MTLTGNIILLVEDEPQVRKMIRILLEKHGYSVLEAANGEQAIGISAAHPHGIDLAVIDIVMPGMSGMDVANCLNPQRPEMKVLYISGMVDSVAFAGLTSGAPQLIVRKPFTPEELLDRIRAILC